MFTDLEAVLHSVSLPRGGQQLDLAQSTSSYAGTAARDAIRVSGA